MGDTTDKPISVLLVDEQQLVRAGLRLLIESYPGITVVGEVANFSEAAATLKETPDIILLNLNSFSEHSSIAYLQELMNSAEKARLILLTDDDSSEANLEAVQLGVLGLVHKNESADILIKAIQRVNAGEVWINRALMARVIGGFSNTPNAIKHPANPEETKIAMLTDREREVVTLIGEGLRNKQIAERLFISEITVRHHLTSIFDKLSVSDRFELAIYSYRNGLAKLPL